MSYMRLVQKPQRVLSIFSLLSILVGVWASPTVTQAEEARTWKTVQELSAEELQRIDLSTDTPRDATVPYLPAEPYPFTPPYTAEEMGLLSTDFSHMPRWNCALVEAFGSITTSGYLTTSRAIGLVHYRSPEGLAGQMQTKPGEWYTRWLFQTTDPAEAYGHQSVYNLYRTDKEFSTKADLFVYGPELRRVRRQPQPRRQDKFPGFAFAFDDFLNRDAWEFQWRILGTDVLYETVRFPNARASVTLAAEDGTFYEATPQDLKPMGQSYPHYTSQGGVEAYVVEATPRQDWIPDYYIPRMIYWLDRHTFFPLRIEQYDASGALVNVEERVAKLMNPDLGQKGYSSQIFMYWDLEQDLLSYDMHDAHQVRDWSVKDLEVFFNPDFMRRNWFVAPLKSQATVPVPAEFFLRPALYPDKFPQERKVILPSPLKERFQAQEEAGRLVFAGSTE
jgi:hypothetical protein